MTDFTLVKTLNTLKDNVSVSAGSSTSATVDLRTAHGGLLSVQIKNGATGPTLPCTAYIGISHDTGTTPSASTTWGTDWFPLATLYGTVTNNDVRSFPPVEIPAGAQHLEVVFSGHTGQAITATAKLSTVTKVVSS